MALEPVEAPDAAYGGSCRYVRPDAHEEELGGPPVS